MEKQKKVESDKKTTKTAKAPRAVKEKKEVSKKTSVGCVSFEDLGLKESARSECSVGFATWIRTLMQNWRQGTLGCKTRGEVARSNRKPWKQKGTGRARAGTFRSPLWRGGGIIFGPQPRVRDIRISQITKQRVLGDIANGFLANGKISCLDFISDLNKPKTSEAFSAIKNAGIASDKLILFVKPDDFITQASFSNIPNVNMMYFDQPNAFDLVSGNRWVFLKKDFDTFKDMVVRWL